MSLELRASPQAAALRHAFLGEREVAHVPDLPRDTPVRAVKRVGVIGAGTMGGGIAMCFANAGLAVKLLEAEPAALDRGMETLRRNYAASVARGSLTEAQMQSRLALIEPTLDWQQLARSRPDHRGRVRGFRGEARGAAPDGRDRQAGRDPRDQHLLPGRRETGRLHQPAAGRDRHALFQPRQRHAAAGERAHAARPRPMCRPRS